MKPNFHWVIHMFDQLHDYGPAYGFWSFVVERLNKFLKGYRTNSHGNGEVESTFMREFERETSLNEFTRTIARSDSNLSHTCKKVLAMRKDNRGTVASLVQEMDELADADADCTSFLHLIRRLLNTIFRFSQLLSWSRIRPRVAVLSSKGFSRLLSDTLPGCPCHIANCGRRT